MHSFLVLPTVAVQSLALGIQWLKLYAQWVFLFRQLLGNVTGVTPEGEVVRFGQGRVGRPPVTLPIMQLLALFQQGGGVLIVQGGPGMRG